MVEDAIDTRLMAEWLAGDPAAADALVERHFDGLMAYATRRAYGRVDPEEAVQNVFLKLIQKARAWDPLQGTLRSWLVTILENEFRSAYRTEKARSRYRQLLAYRFKDFQDTPTESFSICDQHDQNWFNPFVLREVISIVERLQPERAAFLLKPATGFPCADRAALSRARRKIAEKLGIRAAGPELTIRIARELILTKECGKMPKELFA
jgi:RNA polymerase sigma factor (sigma-70 family)